MPEKLKYSKASYKELMLKYLALKGKCNSLESVAKIKEEQLNASKSAFEELTAENLIFKYRWKNLEITAEKKSEELRYLKEDSQVQV